VNISCLEASIHYRFSQVKHAETALTHSSYANESGGGDHNERLEYLGDAVLELCISEEGFKRYPDAPEGILTRIRSDLVKEESLAVIARGISLHEYILLGKGEERQGGRDRDALLADALEALFGAIFLDAGFNRAREVILAMFETRWPKKPMLPVRKDYKSRLQEVTQRLFQDRPLYVLTGTRGPEHQKIFDVEVTIPDGRTFDGSGSGVRRAEQHAASRALEALGEPFD